MPPLLSSPAGLTHWLSFVALTTFICCRHVYSPSITLFGRLWPARKHPFLERFPYVCPEPVLANVWSSVQHGAKKTFSFLIT